MQIFAKRTKKKAAKAEGPRTVHKSDPVVEELLKKDPSEWNAKERRMVKRYRDRKETEPSTEKESDENDKAEDTADKEIEKPTDTTEKSDNEGSSSSSDDENKDDEKDDDSSDSSDEDSVVQDAEEKDEKESSDLPQTSPPTTEEKATKETPATENNDDVDDDKVPKEHEIWGVLDKLNSKQKRTLSRKLERLGKAVLDEVEEEANKILDEAMPIVVDSKRDQTEAASTGQKNGENGEPKKKKRKKETDWSHLSAEERLRREEQRKKQQEAAERRARGEDITPGHKRPLNSARRRANRRKPKWAPKAPSGAPDISDYKREHHSSGFQHRKKRGVE
jgi:hypothetical protein